MKTLLLAGAVALGLATAAVASDATKTPPVKDILAKSSPRNGARPILKTCCTWTFPWAG